MKSIAPVLILLITFGSLAKAQKGPAPENPYVVLGRKALMDGDFKLAVSHLEKALPSDSTNADVLYVLGYSYYLCPNYPKAVTTFSKVLSLRPREVMAYYYRGKARDNMATEANTTLSYADRERLLHSSIQDFTKAIELNGESMIYYQNRGIAYRDLGILKSQKNSKIYDKAGSAVAYKACVADLQRVLDANASRTDLVSEIKKAKVYMTNLENK